MNALHPDKISGIPLHQAVARGHVNLVAFLLMNGADIYSRDGCNKTPLELAEAIAFSQISQTGKITYVIYI